MTLQGTLAITVRLLLKLGLLEGFFGISWGLLVIQNDVHMACGAKT